MFCVASLPRKMQNNIKIKTTRGHSDASLASCARRRPFVFRKFHFHSFSRQSPRLSLDIKCENNVSFHLQIPPHCPSRLIHCFESDESHYSFFFLLFTSTHHPLTSAMRGHSFIHGDRGSWTAEDWPRCPAGALCFSPGIKQVRLVFLALLETLPSRGSHSKSISGPALPEFSGFTLCLRSPKK